MLNLKSTFSSHALLLLLVGKNLGRLQYKLLPSRIWDTYSLSSSPAVHPNLTIATVVTIAEILKNNGLAIEKKITTSTVDMKDESRGRPVQKAKIEILLGKSAEFDELMAIAAEERESGYAEEQT